MIEKINQSFIKDARSYFSGEGCGNIMKEKYINDRLVEDEEPGAMAQGAYFEWVFTELMLGKGKGSLPKNGLVPQPQYMKTPLKAVADKKRTKESLGVDDMEAAYRKCHKLAERLKGIFDDMGLKIMYAGRKYEKGSFVGTIDLVCACTKQLKFADGTIWNVGDQIVIDLKLSGLLNDRWSKHGWMGSPQQKEYHGTQAKHYHMLTGLPFYFWVNQSNQKEEDDADIKLLRVPIDGVQVDDHVDEANRLFIKFRNEAEFGFVARPSLSRCKDCPLRADCKDKHEFPHPEVFDLTIERN